MTVQEGNTVRLDQHRILVLVWFAFVATLLVYLVLPRLVDSSAVSLHGGLFSDISRPGLWTVAFVIAGILWWWNQRYLTREALLNSDRGRWGSFASNFAARKIVAFALAEAIAIYGLLLALIGRYLWDQLLLSGLAAALLVHLYPSRAFFDELAREAEMRSLSSGPG
jgi:hypothetical protein